MLADSECLGILKDTMVSWMRLSQWMPGERRLHVHVVRQVEGHSARRSVVMWLMAEIFLVGLYTDGPIGQKHAPLSSHARGYHLIRRHH